MKENKRILSIWSDQNSTDVSVKWEGEIISEPSDSKTDLTKVKIEGYQFSHKEYTKDGEVFIYNPKK